MARFGSRSGGAGGSPSARSPARLGAAALAACVCFTAPAWSQSGAEHKAAARALGIEGIKLANAGDCAAAVDKLQRAEQLFHAPTILGRLGECQVQLGQLVAGTENLNAVVRENLGSNPPPAFMRAKERAQTVLQEALPKIGKLTVVVEAPAGATYQVTVDGQEMPVALLGVERPTDPGEHLVAVSGDGYLAAQQAVTLPEGGVERLTLTLQVDPNANVAAAPQPAPQAATQAVPADPGTGDDGSTERLVGYVSLGVGGVGLAVGTIFGLSASAKKSDLEGVCETTRCPPSAQDDIDSMNLSATVSTIGFGFGIVGIGVGTYFLLTAGGGAAEASPALAAGLQVSPWIGPGSAGVRGRF